MRSGKGIDLEITIRFTDEQYQKLDRYVCYLKTEYLQAGGKKKSMMEDSTIWYALAGILHREGEEALDTFMKNWTPSVSKRTVAVGYASFVEI